MKHSIQTLEEAKIFVQGATLLGTGGGGFPQEGLRVLTEALEKKGIIQWNDVGQVRDDATAICVFLMGSTAPMTPEKEEEMKRIGLDHRRYPTNMINAISEWEQYTGKTADIIVPLEVGGSNLCAPLAVATMMGKTIVDGDYAGRAIPEIFQISLQKENVDLCPAVSFDKFGNISIMKSAINLPVAERMGKMLSEVAFGSTAIAGFPISGAQLKRLLVRGSVSLSYAVGELIEDAKITGKALETNLKRAGMKKIFEGVCVKKDWKDEGLSLITHLDVYKRQGTDFISLYFSQKRGIDTWNYIFLGNVCILVVAGVLFGFDRALYSIIFQFCSTQIIQLLHKRYQKHTLLIITEQPNVIYGKIKNITNHDATLFKGIGCYKGVERNMLYSVVSSEEVNKVLSAIKEADSCAFVNVIKTDQIGGWFYNRPND